MLGLAEIEEIRNRLKAMWLASQGKLKLSDTSAHFDGLIRISELPFETYDEYVKWWLPQEVDPKTGIVIVPSRMSEREKERFTVLEAHNLLTTNGRAQILGFIGSPISIASQTPFAQWFEVGTYPFTQPSAGDSTVPGALARVVPSSAIVNGTQIDVSCFFGTSQGNGLWTNAGLWGNNATSTLGSGTLMTHSAFAYNKTSANSANIDYLINLT